jgi:DNA ligase-1
MLPRRELLMLAQTYNPDKHAIGGYYMSEKLDGCRCFWDGGLTRGIGTAHVPWAGIINPKTGQPKTKIKPVSTGLWSRYGNPINAPEWFLNALPCVPLDGELWAGRGGFQKVTSTIRKDKPVDTEWANIQYGIFDTPDFEAFIADGRIKNTSQLTDVTGVKEFMQQIPESRNPDWQSLTGAPQFSHSLAQLNDWIDNFNEVTFLIHQTKLPDDNFEAAVIVAEKKREMILKGAEGIFLRAPDSVWIPKRVKTSLKVKGALDDEGTVVGFTSGRKTDKGSKLLGMIGALILDYEGKRLELAGLTNQEREFNEEYQRVFATCNPGVDMPEDFQGVMFKLGDKVTFTYRELTDEGLPKEARYLRKRNDG